MKKFFAILVGAVLTVTTIALTSSCKKDIANAESLVGTEWVCETALSTFTLTFPTSSSFKFTETAKGIEPEVYNGTFIIFGNKSSLTGSSITLTPTKKWYEEDLVTVVGEFKSESKLVLDFGKKYDFERVVK